MANSTTDLPHAIPKSDYFKLYESGMLSPVTATFLPIFLSLFTNVYLSEGVPRAITLILLK